MMWFNMHIAIQGIIAGIIMGMFAMIMNISGITSLNLTEYMGCMLTNKKTGLISFLTGFTAHIIASVMFGMIYMNIIIYFKLGMNLKIATFLAIGHTILSGIMMKIMDQLNSCVTSKKIKSMNFFAIGHGQTGMLVYITAHMLYTYTFMYLVGASMTWGPPKLLI